MIPATISPVMANATITSTSVIPARHRGGN
jgi:hypothetical protein